MRRAFDDMGVMRYAELDGAAVLENDARVAEEFDARRFVERETGTA